MQGGAYMAGFAMYASPLHAYIAKSGLCATRSAIYLHDTDTSFTRRAANGAILIRHEVASGPGRGNRDAACGFDGFGPNCSLCWSWSSLAVSLGRCSVQYC